MQLTDPVAATAAPAGDGAHAIFDVLRAWGIDLLFTCPGSTEAAVLDASLDEPGIRVVLTTHESIAVAAADGFARVSGRPAVAYLHANVGLANGVAHLFCAALAHSPVVLLNGMKSTIIGNRGGFTTAPYQRDYVRQHVKLARIALRADGIADDLIRALNAATAEPAGPVYLGLPQDLVEAPLAVLGPDPERRHLASRRRPDPDAVARAAELLRSARAVTIVAGSELAFTPGARTALDELAERLDAPVLIEDRRTLSAAGVTGDHSAFAGSYAPANPAAANADVLVFAGTGSLVEFEPPRGPAQPVAARIVHLCSDPAEIAKVNPVDVGIAANPELGLRDLLAALGATSSASRRRHRDDAVAAHRTTTAARRTALRARYGETPIHPLVLMELLDEVLPRDCFVVNDAVTSGAYLIEGVVPGSAREHLTTSGGSLGWGMGGAIGVQLARPEARVVCVIGDGVFQFGIQALFTAAQLRLPLLFVVVDNVSYAAVRAALKRFRRNGRPAPYPASDLAGPDIAAIAHGFGAAAETVDCIPDLRGALERALAVTDRPSVVVVKTDPEHTGP
jgi:benzoylformate decarboxylase